MLNGERELPLSVFLSSGGGCGLDLLQVDLLAHGGRSEPCLAAKRPTASDEVARGLETCLGAATRRLTNLWVALLSKINCRLLANGKKDNEYNV